MRARHLYTRGWTPDLGKVGEGTVVSPAHAGMDPSPPSRAGATARFPRTRGDGPDADARWVTVAAFPPHTRGWTQHRHVAVRHQRVSPAHAGMDRCRGAIRLKDISFPRTRGDGPSRHGDSWLPLSFPLHTRGWTVHRGIDRLVVVVSPAHAGMDPATASTAGKGARHCFADL